MALSCDPMNLDRAPILFVDDDPRLLDGIRRMLRSHVEPWQASFAGSVADAMRQLDVQRPSVIVSDVTMPGETGFDLLKKVRDDPALARIPLIMLTGNAESDL